MITLQDGLTWKYTSLKRVGVCRIDQGPFWVVLELSSSFTREVPDVLQVEKWLEDALKTPTTTEELALLAKAKWGFSVKVTGYSHNHGNIEASTL